MHVEVCSTDEEWVLKEAVLCYFVVAVSLFL